MRVLACSVIAVTTFLTACGGSSSGGSSDEGVRPLPGPNGTIIGERYQPLGDDKALLQDTVTSLVWKRCSLGQRWDDALSNCMGSAQATSWPVAISYIDQDGFRLPTLEELSSLVYCNDIHGGTEQIGDLDIWQGCPDASLSPTVLNDAFTSVEQGTYWVSDDSPNAEDLKLGVNFTLGKVSDLNNPQAGYPVLLVRDPEDNNPTAADGVSTWVEPD